MPFYKKPYNKQQKVYYPCAMMQGNSVETETIAKDLAKISTVSNFDVQAVLGGISGVMHTRMAQGKSVHINGLGYFRYVRDTTGVNLSTTSTFRSKSKPSASSSPPNAPNSPTALTPVPLWIATS